MRLTASEFENEKRYQGLMYLLKLMLRDGLLSDHEYVALSKEYAKKIMPGTGSLLARHELLCMESRANIGRAKEVIGHEGSEN